MKILARLLLGGLGVALLALAVLIARSYVLNYRRAAESERWPVAEGKILLSWVEPERPVNDYRKVQPMRPDVEYAYEVAGTRYRGGRVSYVEVSGQEASQKVVDRYPKDSSVKVHYLPTDPGVSVLEPGSVPFRFKPWIAALILVLMAMGCGFGVSLMRRLDKARSTA